MSSNFSEKIFFFFKLADLVDECILYKSECGISQVTPIYRDINGFLSTTDLVMTKDELKVAELQQWTKFIKSHTHFCREYIHLRDLRV